MDQASTDADKPAVGSYIGTYSKGVIRLGGPVDWPEGTRVEVRPASSLGLSRPERLGVAIIAGFGLAGRWVADIFDRHGIDYVVVEKNPSTVTTQRGLGRKIIQGDISEEKTLRQAGIDRASILALTIPDETAVLRATALARKLKPGVYIVARTTYWSSGLQAARLGADEVVKAEQSVAREFYEKLLRKVCVGPSDGAASGQ